MPPVGALLLPELVAHVSGSTESGHPSAFLAFITCAFTCSKLYFFEWWASLAAVATEFSPVQRSMGKLPSAIWNLCLPIRLLLADIARFPFGANPVDVILGIETS